MLGVTLVKSLISIDSNILIYAEGVNDEASKNRAGLCIAQLDFAQVYVASQALGELYRVLIQKGGRTSELALQRVEFWSASVRILHLTDTSFRAALELATTHKLQIWDAIILAVSAEQGCRCLLSEDLQDGFVWRGVEVINPLTRKGMNRLNEMIAI